MIDVRTTREFDRWLVTLANQRARNRIARRITPMRGGQMGDHTSVGDGVGEFRIDEGPCYRLYFTRRGVSIIILLCGGDKDSQRRDRSNAKSLAQTV